MKDEKMRYFSMFSGIGGFELGIERATKSMGWLQQSNEERQYSQNSQEQRGMSHKWECVGFSEIDKHAIATFESHFPTVKNYGDATKINPTELPDFDMLCGGFPCQSFSIAGKRKGFQDTRGTLFHEILRIAKAKRPRLLLLENDKGLLSADDGRCFATIISSLDELGYDVEWQVLNSKYFGVPQNRERVFIIGHLRGEPFKQVFPLRQSNEETKGECKMETVTMQWDTSGKGYNSQQDRAYATDGVMCCLPNANPDNKLNVILPIAPTLNRGTNKTGTIAPKVMVSNSSKREFKWQTENSPTILGRDYKEPKVVAVLTPDREEKRQNGRRFKDDGEDMFTLTGQDVHGVMQENNIRRLTPTECARLQGFPDNWTIGSDTQRYKQCGNAVTVNVIEAIIQQMNEGENFFPTEDIIIAKSDKSSEDLPSPETVVSASPTGRI